MPGRRAIYLLVSGLVAVAACGGADEQLAGGGGTDSLTGLLGLVADTSGNRSQVVYGSLARVREAYGIAMPDGDSDAYVHELMAAAGTGWMVAEPLARAAAMPEIADEMGFDITAVDASLQTGAPPDVLAVFTGRINGERVDHALTTFEPFADEVTVGDRQGVATYRFGEEGAIDVEHVTPARPIGENIRVGADDGTMWWARTDAALDASIDATAGERPSLADDEAMGTVAGILDREGAASAALLGDPEGYDRGMAEAEPLPRWDAAALGEQLASEGATLVVVLDYDDAGTAATAADRLATRLHEGRSGAMARPWSDLCTDPAVTSEGTTVVGRCTLDRPGRALSIVASGDTLLDWAA